MDVVLPGIAQQTERCRDCHSFQPIDTMEPHVILGRRRCVDRDACSERADASLKARFAGNTRLLAAAAQGSENGRRRIAGEAA